MRRETRNCTLPQPHLPRHQISFLSADRETEVLQEESLRSNLLSSWPRVQPLLLRQSPHRSRAHSAVALSPTPTLQNPLCPSSLSRASEGRNQTRGPQEEDGAACPDFRKCSGLCAKIQNCSLPELPPLPTSGFCSMSYFPPAVWRGDWTEERKVKMVGMYKMTGGSVRGLRDSTEETYTLQAAWTIYCM